MEFEQVLEKAMEWGKRNYPESNKYRHCAFANSVTYLVTGGSGGYGGPSIREHAVSWALTGDGTREGCIQYPDGRIPRAGTWNFEAACQFAAPICFGNLPAIARKIYEQEYCFNDDPDDLDSLNSQG